MLRTVVTVAVGFICVTLWLIMLEATHFSLWSVGVGLIGGLFLTGIAP